MVLQILFIIRLKEDKEVMRYHLDFTIIDLSILSPINPTSSGTQ